MPVPNSEGSRNWLGNERGALHRLQLLQLKHLLPGSILDTLELHLHALHTLVRARQLILTFNRQLACLVSLPLQPSLALQQHGRG